MSPEQAERLVQAMEEIAAELKSLNVGLGLHGPIHPNYFPKLTIRREGE